MFDNVPDLQQYIDIETGLARIRGNKALFAKMLGMYLSSKEFDHLEQCLAEGNMEEAVKAAHTLKGMTGNLSLEKVYQLSTQLMNMLRDGAYDESVMNELREANEKTKEYIDIVTAEFSS